MRSQQVRNATPQINQSVPTFQRAPLHAVLAADGLRVLLVCRLQLGLQCCHLPAAGLQLRLQPADVCVLRSCVAGSRRHQALLLPLQGSQLSREPGCGGLLC
jgi:hypothetical protein